MKKFTKILAVLMLVCMLVSMLPVAAFAVEHEHHWATTPTTHKCTVEDCEEYGTEADHVWEKKDSEKHVCVCGVEADHDWDSNTGKCKDCGYRHLCEFKQDDVKCSVCGKLVKPIGCSGSEDTGDYVEYGTIGKAIDAFNGGLNVTMLNDCEVGADAVLELSGTGIFDLGGCTLSAADKKSLTLEVTGGDVTVKNGTVNAGTMNDGAFKVTGGALTLENVTTAFGDEDDPVDVEVEDGSCKIISGNYVGIFDCDSDASLVIYGGTFEKAPDTKYLATGKGVLKNSEGKYVVGDFTEINPNLSVNLVVKSENGLSEAYVKDDVKAVAILKDLTNGTNQINLGTTQQPNMVDVKTEQPVTVTYSLIYYPKDVVAGTTITRTVEVTAQAVVSFNSDKTKTVEFKDNDLKFPITVKLDDIFNTPTSVKHGSRDITSYDYSSTPNTVIFAVNENLISDNFVVVYEAPEGVPQEVYVDEHTRLKAVGSSSSSVYINAALADGTKVKSHAVNTINVKGYHEVDEQLRTVLKTLGETIGTVERITAVRIPNAAVVNASVDGTTLTVASVPSTGDAGRGESVTFTSAAMKVVKDEIKSNDLALVLASNESRTKFVIMAFSCTSDGTIGSLPICASGNNDVFADGTVIVQLETKNAKTVPSEVNHSFGKNLARGSEIFYNEKIAEADQKTFNFTDPVITMTKVNSFSKFEVNFSELYLEPVAAEGESYYLGSVCYNELSTLKTIYAVGNGELTITAAWDDEEISFAEQYDDKGLHVDTEKNTIVVSGTPDDKTQVREDGEEKFFTFTVSVSDNLGNSVTGRYKVDVVDKAYQVKNSTSNELVGNYDSLEEAALACVTEGENCDIYVLKNMPDDDAVITINVANIYGNGKTVGSIVIDDTLENSQTINISNITLEDLTLNNLKSTNKRDVTLNNVTSTGTVTSYGVNDGDNIRIESGDYAKLSGDAGENAFCISGGVFTAFFNGSTKESDCPVLWLARDESKNPIKQSVAVKSGDRYIVKELVPAIIAVSNSRTFVKNSSGTLTFTTNIPYAVVEQYYKLETNDDGVIYSIKDKDGDVTFSLTVGSAITQSTTAPKYTYSKSSDGYLNVTLTNTYLKSKTASTYYLELKTDMGNTAKEEGKFFISASGKTGDTSNIVLWLSLMIACAAVGAVVFVVVMKKQGRPFPFTKKKD